MIIDLVEEVFELSVLELTGGLVLELSALELLALELLAFELDPEDMEGLCCFLSVSELTLSSGKINLLLALLTLLRS